MENRPLALVPIERFFLWNDHPEHAMVFRVLLRFSGEVDRPKLESAFQAALQQQPLLTSLVRTNDHEQVWDRASHLPPLQWESEVHSAATLHETPVSQIELRDQPGVVCRICPVNENGKDGLTVLLDIHHACCDGQGARQFLFDWFINYDRLVRGENLQPVLFEPERLKDRGEYRTMTPPIGTWEGLRNLYCTVRGRTVRLPERTADTASEEFLAEEVLSIEETARLRQLGRSCGVRINEIGLTAAFAAFAEVFSSLSQKGWITLLHPVDLRWPSDLKMPACNRVGVSFLRRRATACQDPGTLQRGLQEEMNYIKQRYVGAEFLRGLAALDGWPGLLGLIESWGWFVPTLQFTCLGNVTRLLPRRLVNEQGEVEVGGLKVHHISGFMQRGRRLPISLTACETHQRLTLTARINLKTMPSEQAQQFFNRFVGLVRLAGDSP